jgi:hypothetical protein
VGCTAKQWVFASQAQVEAAQAEAIREDQYGQEMHSEPQPVQAQLQPKNPQTRNIPRPMSTNHRSEHIRHYIFPLKQLSALLSLLPHLLDGARACEAKSHE